MRKAIELITKLFQRKPEVPELVQIVHNQEMSAVGVFAKTAESIDSDKFSSQEFLMFVKMKYCLARGIEEYAGLDQSIKLLQGAIEAKNSYLTLDQTESRYRSSKQQDFYKYIESLLASDYEDKAAFKARVAEKLVETLPHVKTEEGKVALKAYQTELESLADHELGLKLLSLFKAYQLANYSVLRTISDIVETFREKQTLDYPSLVASVISKYEVFEKLKNIIGVANNKSKPETYARMLQYIALTYRHGKSYAQFAELLQVMRKWYLPYRAILDIRRRYPRTSFKLPKQFSEDIAGVAIYDKYRKSLTDAKTGFTYVDFGDDG
ncbi:MAG: hypothetical protein GPJ22_04725 [Microcystis aeruginosa LL13-03]|uniref:Uncharacterized protein n=1 Tax=Microcystis aeruginosa G11-04 TaxID=2685956 RepID=A0A966L5R9_MICAE|nr:hypothetical protein [Microcystis aeruginosa LL13-03]NCR66681.1 hypothetical protein [Microcystis aeruginosa LL11-07]NCR88615.1 hypothetical protein [Microcystis aeruginosa G13-10]NCS19191.1 hypothetical protein [Microcystis aeruginosa G11-06]NCS34143.1 hypothetical protein [Microcystis aeruginosa G11-01]NCS53805.1 hypothetical protein [Microcystis aeruginosa G13-05]NCS57727.1 hypothetical protein [Microcystis aeruginosa G11-04]NCT44472.1 hypothetical protein [Microcystis aeruginosa G11-0